MASGWIRCRIQVETSDEELGERADRDGEQHGPDADGAAEQPADGEHRDLDAGTRQAQRLPGPRGQAGHQAVARARTEAGTDVEPGGDTVQRDAAEEQRDAGCERVGRRQDAEGGVGGQADHDDVARRAEAGTLPQRDPGQQHQRADDDHDAAQRQAGVPGQALVQHVPGSQAQARGDHQRGAGAEQHEPGEELRQTARQR